MRHHTEFVYQLTNEVVKEDLKDAEQLLKDDGLVLGEDYIIKGRGQHYAIWTLGDLIEDCKEKTAKEVKGALNEEDKKKIQLIVAEKDL